MPQTPTLPDAKAHFPATEILEYTVQFQTGQQPVKLTPLQTAQAQGSPEPTQPPGKSDEAVPEIPEYLQNQKPHRLFLGPDIFYRNYNEEEIVPGFKSFEYGFLYGVNLEYDYVRRNSIYLGANFRYGTGQTNYRGGLQFLDSDEIIPFESKTDNQFINVEGRIGYTFKADKVGRVLVTVTITGIEIFQGMESFPALGGFSSAIPRRITPGSFLRQGCEQNIARFAACRWV
jgi:hypothetical protein